MRTILTILLAMVLTLGVARADHCEATEPTATIDTPIVTYYVVNDPCQPGCLFSIWVYEESNGEPGLQRCADTYCSDRCDRIIF